MDEKIAIHTRCVELVNEKINEVNKELQEIKNSAFAETKSSMGDKSETSREMMIQESNKLSDQLEILTNQLTILRSIDATKALSEVKLGALVETSMAKYFLSVPLGLIQLPDQQVFTLSPNAPIAKMMLEKRASDSFTFNGKTQKIFSIK